MAPYASIGDDSLHLGDCRDVLAALPACSVDAVLTDPPYELGFMGKRWDATGVAFDADTWRAVLRVLKPGGHLLAFGGTRTSHRMVCAIEDAGFEVRDALVWLYGSGFPKSLDVSKAIDKARRRDYVEAAVRLGLDIPGNSLHDWTKGEHAPSDAWWERFRGVLTVEQWGEIEREVTGWNDRKAGWFTSRDGHSTTAPATDAARQWDGWGTALKPAHEPICLARKPLAGTVAANVLEHGTGALNVDGCRIPAADKTPFPVGYGRGFGDTYAGDDYSRAQGRTPDANPDGRWPANVLLDGEAAALLDEQSGELVSGANPARRGSNKFNTTYGTFAGQEECTPARGRDGGGASRFFYVAKASRDERSMGGAVHNDHATVKPTALLRYLARLITPPGGTVLDPFTGSGSTWLAAQAEGFAFVGCELLEHHCAITVARVRVAAGPLFAAAGGAR